MKTMNAKDYAVHSGYPLSTIKTYCKEKILPNERNGRKYLINVELADEILKHRMMSEPVQQVEEPKLKYNFSFIETMNRLQRGLPV